MGGTRIRVPNEGDIARMLEPHDGSWRNRPNVCDAGNRQQLADRNVCVSASDLALFDELVERRVGEDDDIRRLAPPQLVGNGVGVVPHRASGNDDGFAVRGALGRLHHEPPAYETPSR
jgi:hypothetical protein